MKYDEIICIGACCEVSFAIQNYNLSLISYPFDWLLVHSLADVSKTISNNFKEFENIHIEKNPDYARNIYQLDNLNIWLPHYNKNLDSIIQKCENFRKILVSNKKVLFIYKSHIFRSPTFEEVELFIKTIKSLSNIDFDFLIINECQIGSKPCNYPDGVLIKNLFGNPSLEFSEPNAKCIFPCNWDSKIHNNVWNSILKTIN